MIPEPQGLQRVTALGCKHLLPAQIATLREQFDPALYDLDVVSTGRPVELAFGVWPACLWYSYRIHGKPSQVAAIMHPGCTGVQAHHGHAIKPLTPSRESWLRGRRVAGGFDLFALAVTSRIPGALVQPYLLRGGELQLVAT